MGKHKRKCKFCRGLGIVLSRGIENLKICEKCEPKEEFPIGATALSEPFDKDIRFWLRDQHIEDQRLDDNYGYPPWDD